MRIDRIKFMPVLCMTCAVLSHVAVAQVNGSQGNGESSKPVPAESKKKAPSGETLESRVSRLEKMLAEQEKQKDDGATVKYKKNLEFASDDGRFKVKVGGRIHVDWAFMSQDNDAEAAFGKFDDGTEVRRARLYMSGTLYKYMEFKAQYDFGAGDADFKDVYGGIKGLGPLGTLRIGQYKVPYSLEELTSSNNITFMERSAANGFSPSRNSGFMFKNAVLDDRMTWAAMFFRDTDDYGIDTGDGDYFGAGRVTGLPYYEEKGKKLVHLGAAVVYGSPDETVRIRDPREAHLAPRTVDTGAISSGGITQVGVEAAAVWDAFSVQGEWKYAKVNSAASGSPDFSGWYVQATYTVTGESRSYKTKDGVFGTITPEENFDPASDNYFGGAWELAARVSQLDLSDGSIQGGEYTGVTVGLNWYLNPNARFMANYIRGDYDEGVDGDSDIFQMRFQFTF